RTPDRPRAAPNEVRSRADSYPRGAESHPTRNRFGPTPISPAPNANGMDPFTGRHHRGGVMSKQSKRSVGQGSKNSQDNGGEVQVAGQPRRLTRGMHAGPRFATQANALAGLYRSCRVVVEVGGDRVTPEELEQIAAEQTRDEHEDARLQAEYATYHAEYLQRS